MLERDTVESNLSALRRLLDSPEEDRVTRSATGVNNSVGSPAGTSTQSRVDVLLDALHSRARVNGLTHVFYRYPARFSPQFARAVIETFSSPGDCVLDPFVGGGTSAVEAVASGRSFVGVDLNPLACFVARAKTTVLKKSQLSTIKEWADKSAVTVRVWDDDPTPPGWEDYTRNVPWHLRRACAQLLATLEQLPPGPMERFARCSILSAAQKSLDCRSEVPSVQQFLRCHADTVQVMCDGMDELRAARETHRSSGAKLGTSIVQANASALSAIRKLQSAEPPSLVFTSPPYVDVHVLYNRWQVIGRRETRAPYWIIGQPEERGPASFTFAARGRRTAGAYMQVLKSCFSEVTRIISPASTVVQLVAFHDPATQLDLYLEALEAAGLQSVFVDSGGATSATIGCRSVPNRRWYAQLNKQSKSSKEFLLIHRKKPS